MSEDRGRGPSTEALKKSDIWIALVFAFVTLTATLIYTIKAKPAFPGDIERYIHVASSLLAKDVSGAINYHYPPGYPAMIAVAGLAVNDFETAARAAGIIFAALTVFPVYLLAFYLFGRRAAVFAACLFSLRLVPELSQSQSEQVAIFFISSAMLLGLIALDRRRSVWFLATGLVFGLGFLVKPEAWVYFLTYLLIVCLTAVVSIANKTPGGSSGPARKSGSDAGSRGPLSVRARPFIFYIAVLVSGYFMAELESPSLWYLAALPPETQEVTPANDLEDVIIYAVAKGARYIVFHKSRSLERYKNQLPLLDPGFTSPVLRPVYRKPAPGGDTYVIYEVLPVKCGRADVEE